MSRPPVDVAVIGGGIVGTSLAAFLAGGGLRVRLYERTEIAAGASGRNSGVVQHPFDAVLAGLYLRSLAEYRLLARELDDERGDGDGFALGEHPVGLLYVGRDEPAARALAAAWSRAWPGTQPEVVAGTDLRRLEPALAPDLVACRLEIGFPVGPAVATRAFDRLARRRAADVVVGGEAEPIGDGGRVVGVSRDGEIDPAAIVVVAAGPWTPRVVDPGGRWRPIRGVWGVVAGVVVEGAPRHGLEAIDIEIEPSVVAETGDRDEPRIAAAPEPRDRDVDFSLAPGVGSSALGSTFLAAEPDPAAWLAPLRRVGARYVPAVASAPVVGLRHCARPVSRDGRPLVGRAPWLDGLWIVAGHGPWGISTGPGSARLVADSILDGRATGDGGAAPAIPAALDAGRFGAP